MLEPQGAFEPAGSRGNYDEKDIGNHQSAHPRTLCPWFAAAKDENDPRPYCGLDRHQSQVDSSAVDLSSSVIIGFGLPSGNRV